MAEAALFGVAKSVLQALASPAMDEFRLLWGQKKQLERLQDTVTTIGDVLHDADRRQAADAAVQGWLTRLRVVLYDADDLFDLISAQLLHNKVNTGNKILRKVRHFSFMVKTAHKVKDIRERLDAIASDIKGFGFLPVQTAPDQPHRFQRKETHSYFPSNEVIGREKEREDIVKLLLLPECLPAEQNGVSVVAVIGIGGLGKTTLAQLVYNDQRVQKGFDLCVWACINDFSCLEEVLKALMKSVTKSEVGGFDLDTLQSKFRNEIEGKRFLLVLDDVWDEDTQNWHKLKILLDCGKPRSMVLATTRSVKAAQSLSAVEPYYHLSGMSDESAWLLFDKMAFGGKHLHYNPRLEGLGQQIVKKCANVPLLIVTIASFLRHQEESKWCSLVDGELPTVAPGDYNKVIQVLKISYNEFPYPVKRCFVFCSLFPKDYEFDKDQLIRLWIAEGFVEVVDAYRNLEDIAEEYFFYLVDRCFFQNMEMGTYTWKMHDLVHDLAKEVAGLESILVDQVNAQRPWDNKTLRHVSFVGDVCSVSHSKSLRTFLHFNRGYVGTNTLNEMLSSFKVVRVLNLSQLGIMEVPASIGELIHLRLLDLSENGMERLPSSICSLHHLQSLILEGCQSLKELPEEIGKLISLRHLVVPDWVSLPAGMAALTSLVTLDKRVVHKAGGELRYLEGLDNLSGSLEIDIPETGWENVTVDAQTACLSRKSRLKALKINFKRVESGGEVETLLGALEPHPNLEYLKIWGFGGNRMPPWVSSLDGLVILRLDGCENLIELAPLSRLPSLKELSIDCMFTDMSSMVSIEGSVSYDPEPLLFFPSLEALHLKEMPKLRSWWVQAPTVLPKFPRVTNVGIQNCPELTAAGMPLFALLVEDLELSRVQEEVFWQGIGIDIGSEASILLGNSRSASALQRLSLSNIRGLRSIGEVQIRHLSVLRSLVIYDCEELETVSWRGLAYLTSLEKLVIGRGCKKVKWGVDGDEVVWEPRLRHFEISNVTRSCLKGLKYLTSLETLCLYNFDEELQTSNSEDAEEEKEGMPWKHLQKLRSMELGFGETFSMRGNQQLLRGLKYLTNSLQDLTLTHCKELYLSWTALVSLNHLQNLEFKDVEKVINVVDAPQSLQLSSASLHNMTIDGGSAEWILDIPWKSFSSLRSLQLFRISNLEALPEGIQHLASLKALEIFECERVVSLPYWISSLSSLHRLHIRWCSGEIKKRCQRVTGEDWPLIQHIQHVRIV